MKQNQSRHFTYYTTGEHTIVNRPIKRKMTCKQRPLASKDGSNVGYLVGLEFAVDVTKAVSQKGSDLN